MRRFRRSGQPSTQITTMKNRVSDDCKRKHKIPYRQEKAKQKRFSSPQQEPATKEKKAKQVTTATGA